MQKCIKNNKGTPKGDFVDLTLAYQKGNQNLLILLLNLRVRDKNNDIVSSRSFDIHWIGENICI